MTFTANNGCTFCGRDAHMTAVCPMRDKSEPINYATLYPQQRLDVARGEQPQASAAQSAPAGEREAVTMQQVLAAYGYATDHPHKYLRGTTNWCAAFAHSLNEQLGAAWQRTQSAGVPDDLLIRCADWCDKQPKQPWYGRTAGDMVRTFMACQPLAAAPAQPVAQELCKVCKGFGKYQDGDSGTDEDGRAPNIVDCDCADNERFPHPDDAAVDRFAAAMKAKLAKAREKGRGGWDNPDQCSVEFLAKLLVEHLGKGNAGTFEDVANFAMMLHQRGADPQVLAREASAESERLGAANEKLCARIKQLKAEPAAHDQGEVQRLREALEEIRHANMNGPVSESNAGCIKRIEQIAERALAASTGQEVKP